MARSVYFDPFGSAATGYNLGMQQEQNLQQNARNARQTDWNYNNVNPLQLGQLQRNAVRDKAYLPYDISNKGIQNQFNSTELAQARMPLTESLAQGSGITSPYAANLANGLGIRYLGSPDGQNHAFGVVDANGNMTHIGSASPYNLMQSINWQRAVQEQELQNQGLTAQGQYLWGRYGMGGATANQTRADAAMIAAQARANATMMSDPSSQFAAPTVGAPATPQYPGASLQGADPSIYNIQLPQ